MEKMYFRNYSVTCYGPNKGLPEVLQSISEGNPVIMKVEYLMLASFSSHLTIDEIETLLKDNMYSFTIFEMNPDTSRAHMVKDEMQKKLYDNFFYKKIELEDLGDIGPVFSGTVDEGEYIEYEDIEPSKIHSEMYLKDLLATLQEAIDDEEYEYAGELRDEIKEFDPEFYEKFVKNKNFLK